ncbi:DUF2182 domain-containing protein [Hymenobacter edaphi]|uniref:DUF2182 domain-containing protein n=1 Tax=Hymenobacter edaphi TaxID=2211146 RepID=A0A328BFF8_9BACT|nr:DUF2182 domain-containing protein [Hymenobacter edaphi]RAK64586.1 hypothetical protein DLM85_18010 [Hymenobacter edaphi]
MIYNPREYARLRNSVLVVSLLAWLVLLRPAAAPVAYGAAAPPVMSYCSASPAALALTAPAASSPASWTTQLTVAQSLFGGWALMLVAMMAPLLIQPIYHIRATSFARRRARSTTLFVAGYGGGWLVGGAFLLALELAAGLWAPESYLPAGLVALVALIWQASPAKQRYLNRCHRHRPLAAFGAEADRDALMMGVEHSRWCVGSCWAAMLLPMLLPHGHFAAMLGISVLMVCERLDPPRTPAWRWRGFGTALRYVSLRLRGPKRSPAPAALGVGA